MFATQRDALGEKAGAAENWLEMRRSSATAHHSVVGASDGRMASST